MNGDASLGTSIDIPRADHVHPVDTSREPTIATKLSAFNRPWETSTSNIKANGSVSIGTSSNIPRSDHVHPKDTTKADLDGDGKVVTSQASSKWNGVYASRYLNADDAGATLWVNAGANVTLTIPNTADLPVGTEIEIIRYSLNQVTIAVQSPVYIICATESRSLMNSGGVTLKKS